MHIEDHQRAINEQDFRLIVDSIPTLVYTMTPHCELEFVNQQVLDYFGRTVDQLKDWDKVGAVHPDDLPGVYASLQRTLQFEEPHEMQQRLRRHDGVYRWFQPRSRALRNSEGKLVRWYSVLIDIEDLKRAQDAIRTREADFREIVDSIPGLIATHKADGELEFLSQPLLDYTGWTIGQLKDWAPLVHPEDLPRVMDSFQCGIDNGMPFDSDHRIRGRDGSYRWFHHRGVPRRDAGGRIVRWFMLLTDITERKEMEDRLRDNQAFLLEAQRIGRTGSWKHDLATGTLSVTPELAHIYDIRTDEHPTTAEFFFGRIHPEDRGQETISYERAIREKRDFEANYRIVLPDGSMKHIRTTGRPKLNEAGEVVGLLGTATDTTEQCVARNKLEQAVEEIRRLTDRLGAENLALRERERELNLIIESIPGLVWCASPDGAVTYVNQRVTDYTGADVPALVQSGWIDFLHPDDVAPTVQKWQHAVSTGELHDIQYRLRRFDGSYRWFHVVGQPAWTENGVVSRWYGLLIDIDDRKNVEETLRRAEAKLLHATQLAAAGELSASIAHEVNQPLAAVVANGHACLRWLAAQPPNLERAREAADRILRDGRAAGEVVQRVRALFKVGTVDHVVLDLNGIIREVIHLMSSESSRKGVTVAVDLFAGPLPVFGDPVQLQQVLRNLILNGIEAMEPVTGREKTLRIHSTQEFSNHALVSIEDSGVGLPDPSKVFDAFFTTKHNGMGMGLAICRSIIKAHAGRIWALPGGSFGASFCFAIPLTGSALR